MKKQNNTKSFISGREKKNHLASNGRKNERKSLLSYFSRIRLWRAERWNIYAVKYLFVHQLKLCFLDKGIRKTKSHGHR